MLISDKYSNKKFILNRLNQIDNKKIASSDMVNSTRSVVEKAFSSLEEVPGKKIKFAFLVPTRASSRSSEYWSEVDELLPAIKDLPIVEKIKIIHRLPPFEIDSYQKNGEKIGSVIFTPITEDLLRARVPKVILARLLRARVQDAANLAESMGAESIGLGGILPRISNYGTTIRTDMTTTTGHAGTVALFISTFEDIVAQHNRFDGRVGIIGGGAIGEATIRNLVSNFPRYNYTIFDKRDHVNQQNRAMANDNGVQVTIAESNEKLIQDSSVILSAVTTPIMIKGLNLNNKVIIDDSQPGSFSRDDVIDAGGKLVWVVGTSRAGIPVRDSEYNFGSNGLVSNNDYWGCEAEVAAISCTGKFEHAINRPVTHDDITNISRLFKNLSIHSAKPQSHGKLSA